MSSENAESSQRTTVLAERFKTKLCRNWVTSGHCPYEQRCMFAHGDDELRSREWNVRDGLTTETAIKEFQRKFYAANRQPVPCHSQPLPTIPPHAMSHQPYVYDNAYVPTVSFKPPVAQRNHRPCGLGCAPHEPMYTAEGLCACSQCIAAQRKTVLAQQQQLQHMYNLYFRQQQRTSGTSSPASYSPSSDDSDCEFAGVPEIAPMPRVEEYVRRSPEKSVDPLISAFRQSKPVVECP
jgi:hypothetical protein